MKLDASHRPWPPPQRPWSVFMRWLDLAFIHWRAPAGSLRKWVPEELEIQTFDGTPWIGVVPFRMEGIRHRLLPPIPGLSAFPELNVRTYVTLGGKPGIWFFSLDAANKTAVKTARKTYGLPYFLAQMEVDPIANGGVRYRSRRIHQDAPEAEFVADYRPVGNAERPKPGTLEYFLTERYCLYASPSEGKIGRGEILHEPWPLQNGEVEIERCTMLQPLGIATPKEKPVVHFARRQDVMAWRLEEACRSGS
jgi:uncharacterized protein YqjF (DUF2071 family)